MAWDPDSYQEPTGPQGPFSEYGARYTGYGPGYGPGAGPQMPPPRDGSQGAWGAAGPGVYTPPTLWEAIKQLPAQYWRILTRPNAATFDAEQRKASWGIIWAQILGYALFSAIISSLAWLIITAVFLSPLLSSASTTSGGSAGTAFVGFLFLPVPVLGLIVLIGGIGSFFLGQGIMFLLAKAFGGQGSFMAQVYTSLLYQVPIGLGTVVLSLIPFVGSIASLASIYAYFLQYFQLVAVHRLSTGKALAVILIPIGVGIVLAFILIAAYFVIIFSVVHSLQTIPVQPTPYPYP